MRYSCQLLDQEIFLVKTLGTKLGTWHLKWSDWTISGPGMFPKILCGTHTTSKEKKSDALPFIFYYAY